MAGLAILFREDLFTKGKNAHTASGKKPGGERKPTRGAKSAVSKNAKKRPT
jgi:hypothetical protein